MHDSEFSVHFLIAISESSFPGMAKPPAGTGPLKSLLGYSHGEKKNLKLKTHFNLIIFRTSKDTEAYIQMSYILFKSSQMRLQYYDVDKC